MGFDADAYFSEMLASFDPKEFPFRKLTTTDIATVHEMKRSAISNRKIAKHFNVTPQYIGMIVTGLRRIDDTLGLTEWQ